MSLTLNIAPIAFDQVDTTWLADRKPYHYQHELYQKVEQAFAAHKTKCLFLVTPTGSGKTLASYAYSIKNHVPAIGVYPTNELIRDQERSLKDWLDPHDQHQLLRIDSKMLDEWQTALEGISHSKTWETLLNWRGTMGTSIVTNPDILFYTFFGLYGGGQKGKDKKLSPFAGINERLFSLVMNYQIFIFDEFHLYNIKQMADVAFLVGTLEAINPNKGHVYIFASATPDLEAVNWLRNLNLSVDIIECESSASPTARTIAHPVELTILPADLKRWQGTQALLNYLPELQKFVSIYPQTRMVTILDSVGGAINMTQTFRDTFPHKSVGEVHGFSSAAERETALKKELTVGTSTIEVGIDFEGETEKDVLIFEARTASQFIQRFGRLARHKKNLAIPNKIVSFVPEYVYNFLNEQLSDGTTVERNQLNDLVREGYTIPQDFAGYIRHHAPAEFHEALMLVEGMFHVDKKPEVSQGVKNAIQSLTGKTPAQAWGKHRQYLQEKILQPLFSFRGNGFEAAIVDERGTDIGLPIKRYNLMFLLRKGQFHELDDDAYQQVLDRCEARWPADIARERRYSKKIGSKPEQLLGVYGYFSLTSLLDKNRKVWFELPEEQVSGQKGKITIVTELQICTEPEVRLKRLNRHLGRKQIVAWFVAQHPNYITLGRGLPHLFEVHELRVRRFGGQYSSTAYSIVFNQDAFFVDSLGGWYREKREDDAIIL